MYPNISKTLMMFEPNSLPIIISVLPLMRGVMENACSADSELLWPIVIIPRVKRGALKELVLAIAPKT
ncbi:hypothetical protein QQ39_15385 [Pragia fontium]|nr:hypothetical protein QQ39_15385 [Pragia fontium]